MAGSELADRTNKIDFHRQATASYKPAVNRLRDQSPAFLEARGEEVEMMGQLDEKVALVTGGSAGIGLAIARRFAAEGATVYLTGRNKAELEGAVEAIGEHAIGIQSDVSKLDDLDRLFATIGERSGRLDVVVANAGVRELARLGGSTEEHYDKQLNITVKVSVFTFQ